MNRKPTKAWKKVVVWCWKGLVGCVKDFCLETSAHGFKHIAMPRRHWSERLLWAITTGLALWCAIDICLDQWTRYNESPTVVTLEKDFRSWKYGLPGVTACSKNRVDVSKLPSVIKSFWGVDNNHEKYDYYVNFTKMVAESNINHLEGFQEFDDEELNVDLYQMSIDILPEIVIKPITADDTRSSLFKWTKVMTEAGVCFSTNSLAIADVAVTFSDPNTTANYPITCKYTSQNCYVMFEIAEPINFHFHSPYDIMDIDSQMSAVYPSLSRQSEVTVMETRCADGVRQLTSERRRCLYADEPVHEGKQVYSTNTCRLSCRSKMALKMCGCRPFYYPNEEGPQCSASGMACLSRLSQHLLKAVKCTCTPQCLDMIFREVAYKDTKWEHGPFVTRGSVKYTVQAPRTRYTREIVFYFQDLIVSFGGATGLFLGASFISFVEIIYFVFERFLRHLFEDGKSNEKLKVGGGWLVPFRRSFLPRTIPIWNGLSSAVFPERYDMSLFKRGLRKVLYR